MAVLDGAEIYFGNSLKTCHVLMQERLGSGKAVSFTDFCEPQKFIHVR
ncbi:MAG: hypothetical protein ACREQ7_04265 [Candidatus Binatia bacterium]